MLGIGLAAGEGVSVGLLAAIFVSNLPEAIGSATEMRAAGEPRGDDPAAVGRGRGRLHARDGRRLRDRRHRVRQLPGGIDGFAAGALLVMLIDSMIPEAARKGGDVAGLVTVLGFAVAFAL